MGEIYPKDTIATPPNQFVVTVGYDTVLNAMVAIDDTSAKYQLFGVGNPTYRLFRVVMVTTGTYTPTAGVKALFVECQGGGGAGGGVPAPGNNNIAGGGGAGGSYSASWITSVAANYAVTIGTGGTAVSGSAGNSGNNTDFGAGPTVRGLGGSGGAAGIAGAVVAGGWSSSVGVGDFTAGMNGGEPGIPFATGLGGGGGDGMFGGGAASNNTTGAGSAGTSGGGGSGGCTPANSTATAGGAGGDGWCRVWEFM